jgi:MFS family permease
VPSASAVKPGLLINRNYTLLWLGQSFSILGDIVFSSALVYWVGLDISKGQSWAPLAVGGLAVAILATDLIIGPFAGVFADRWNKRRTMLWMDALRTVLVAALSLATGIVALPFVAGGHLTALTRLLCVYAGVLLASACAQFFLPSRMVLLMDVVPEDLRGRASGLIQTTSMMGLLLGPPIAALLYFGAGVQWTLWLDALTFAISFATVWLIRAPAARRRDQAHIQTGSFRKEFLDGLGFFRQSMPLTTMLLAVAIIMFGAAPMNALLIFFVQRNLHAAPSSLAILDVVFAVGGVLGALLASGLMQRIGLMRALLISLFFASVGVAVFARVIDLAQALVVMGIVGIFQAWMNTATGPLLMRVVPRAYLGRVTALLGPLISLAQITGTALASWAASTVLSHFSATIVGLQFGTYDTIFLAGGILCVLGTLYATIRLGFADPPQAVDLTGEEMIPRVAALE